MPIFGLARVASALNANDQCGARIAAVHLEMPISRALQYATHWRSRKADQIRPRRRSRHCELESGATSAHGTPPNPGWFAPTGGAESSSRLRLAENRENSHRTGAETLPGDRVHLPEGHYIDELADFVEWWPTPDQKTKRPSEQR